jgi:hypothetical protein
MTRAIALAAPLREVSLDAARLAVVHGCAIALIVAGLLR